MLYQIENKYYIRVAPMKYTEVKFVLKHNDVVIQPTSNKIESTGTMTITQIDFQKEKDNIKSKLLNNNCSSDKQEIVGTKYRKRR